MTTGVLLAAAMLAAVFANPTIGTFSSAVGQARTPAGSGSREPRPPEGAVTPPSPTIADQGLPWWVNALLTALCITVVALVVGLMVWLLLRDRWVERRAAVSPEEDQPPTPAETQRRLRAAVDEVLADLDDADVDPRRAVIACWVRLEAAAAAAGTPRHPGDTSTDFVGRLLASHRVNAGVLAGLADVYREARFATHTIDQNTREQARAALSMLREELHSPNSWAAEAR